MTTNHGDEIEQDAKLSEEIMALIREHGREEALNQIKTLTGQDDNDYSNEAGWAVLQYIVSAEPEPDNDEFERLMNEAVKGLHHLGPFLYSTLFVFGTELQEHYRERMIEDPTLRPTVATQPNMNYPLRRLTDALNMIVVGRLTTASRIVQALTTLPDEGGLFDAEEVPEAVTGLLQMYRQFRRGGYMEARDV